MLNLALRSPDTGSVLRRDKTTGEPGGFANAHYEALYKPWRRRVRIVAPIVFLVLAGVLVPLFLLIPAHREFYVGLLLGSFLGMYMAMVDSPPEWIDKWRRGAEGERQTAKRLRDLKRAGWHVLHDMQRPRWNLDHLVVGPGGVFLLDTKAWSGEIEIAGGRVAVRHSDDPLDSWSRPSPSGFLKRAAADLSGLLRTATGIAVFVQPAVVVWGDFPARRVEDEGVSYLHGDELARWLRDQPSRLSPEVATRIAAHLANQHAARNGNEGG